MGGEVLLFSPLLAAIHGKTQLFNLHANFFIIMASRDHKANNPAKLLKSYALVCAKKYSAAPRLEKREKFL